MAGHTCLKRDSMRASFASERVFLAGDDMDARRADRLEAIEIARGSALRGDQDGHAFGLEQIESPFDPLAVERQVHGEGVVSTRSDRIDRVR
jgi:hypothetical protein